jgi:CubicO group peptidase (beta-lactamase class C family)
VVASAVDESLRDVLQDVVSDHPVVGLAMGVVNGGGLMSFAGHGVADVQTGRPVVADTGFRVASITKTVTGVAIMQLHEQGLVDLDAAANDYLRAFRLVNADPGWPQATVRQLLTHTAGLGELARPSGMVRQDFGESVPTGERVPTLAELYAGALTVRARPGSRFVYGNHSPATLGQIVEDVSGVPLGDYVSRHITGPLGMTASSMRRSPTVTARLATGYEVRARGVHQVRERDMATVGAAGLYSTPADMARYLAALLAAGRAGGGPILSRRSWSQMVAPQYQPHPRIPGMGLSFMRRDMGGRLVVGHQGTHPGFHSQVFLAPDDDLAVMAFTNGARAADLWLPPATLRLLRRLLGDAAAERPAAAQRPDEWAHLVGRYRLDAGPTDVRLRGFLGLGAQVVVRGGALRMRFYSPVPALARGLPLDAADPDDPDVYRLDLGEPGLDPMLVVFERDARGRSRALHLDVMPLTLHRVRR